MYLTEYTGGMKDKEHEEWLENRNARRAAAKQTRKAPTPPPGTPTDTKMGDDGDDQDGRVWRGETA